MESMTRDEFILKLGSVLNRELQDSLDEYSRVHGGATPAGLVYANDRIYWLNRLVQNISLTFGLDTPEYAALRDAALQGIDLS